jgi:hypothetical protein
MKATAAKPRIIMAHVEGSGMEVMLLRFSIENPVGTPIKLKFIAVNGPDAEIVKSGCCWSTAAIRGAGLK